jgi:hypothetical protein
MFDEVSDSVEVCLFQRNISGTRRAGLRKEQFAVGFVGWQGIERARTARPRPMEERTASTHSKDRQ